MAALRNFWTCCALCTVSFASYSGQTFGQTNSNEASTLKQSQNPNAQEKNISGEQTSAAEDRDGQHDFDFLFGSWSVHNRRLLHPLTGSSTWVEFDGTAIDRPVWDGRANQKNSRQTAIPATSRA